MAEKKKIQVTHNGKTVDVAWYAGATDASIERAVRMALDIAESTKLTLRDEDGDTIALSDSLPSGLQLIASVGDSKPEKLIEPPGPSPYPIVGNIPHLKSGENLYASLSTLTREYGDFVKLKVRDMSFFLCSNPDIVSELLQRTDDFQKRIPERSGLGNLREHTVGDGLFTSGDDEAAWQIAHRVLLPAFSAGALKQYYPRMQEVTDDLLDKLSNIPSNTPFLATDLMTRMTFEAIAYAGFNTRFQTMEDRPIPFVDAMVEVLKDAMESTGQLLPAFFRPGARKRRQKADQLLRETVDQIVKERREMLARGEAVPNDMLQLMLTSKDKTTGERLSDDNIRYQLITFLVAGHETTSGLLSYALYHLSHNPEVEAKLMEEVDQVLGRDYSYRPTYQDIERLDYTQRVLKEALRLEPTAPAFIKMALRDTTLIGRYGIPKGSPVLIFLPSLHRNPKFWDDPERFEPDRFLPDAVAARHPNAYHPFGLGVRSCIGFQFALIEARLVLARFYQRFIPRTADPNYQLKHEQTLTIKPKNLLLTLKHRPEEKGKLPVAPKSETTNAPTLHSGGRSMLVLYGSNMGTSKELADSIARQATGMGFSPVVSELDAKVGDLPTNVPVIIVSSTYNGTPPDNATRFHAWLSNPELAPDLLRGVRFAVLGCGNKQWRGTFQKFPKFIEQRFKELGAESFYNIGSCDADADFDASAESWMKGLWSSLGNAFGVSEAKQTQDERRFTVELVNFAGAAHHAIQSNIYPLQEASFPAIVRRNDELQSHDSERSTRHIEIELPRGVSYRAGDHLGVFPENPSALVERVSARAGLRATDVVILQDKTQSGRLPCGVPIMVRDLLTYHVDLSGPLSRKELRTLASACPCPPEKMAIEALTTESAYQREVIERRLHLIDLLEKYRSIECDLSLLLSLRPLLKPRYYSISSSPRVLSDACSVTVGVLTTNQNGAHHEGLCSHFLADAPVGSVLRVFVRDTKSSFRMPEDPSKDLLLIGPGTGLAPMRGFLQERAALKSDGKPLGETLLFFGCRHPEQDYLYQEELEDFVEAGVLSSLETAFSRNTGEKVYVQDLLAKRAKKVYELLARGAYIFVCGDAKSMAPAVQNTFAKIIAAESGCSLEEATTRCEKLKSEGRYLEDVWAS
jgi:cytochrome P450/NADPH-cytochrome P450 reductase